MRRSATARRWLGAALIGLVLQATAAQGQVEPAPTEGGPVTGTAVIEVPESPFDRPVEAGTLPDRVVDVPTEGQPLLQTFVNPPLGYTGPSSVLPAEAQETDDFVPVEDRWRVGFPEWDRYNKGHPWVDDYPYIEGHWWDPYNQNVIKGDYPIIGQNTFLEMTALSFMISDLRQIPAQTTPFESTANPFSEEFFGRPGNYFFNNFFSLSFDLFHGNQKAFKPVDWRVKVTPIFDVNNLSPNELAIINPDVQRGTSRWRTFWALQEWFLETKLADLSPDYDFVSMRAGSQFFNADFRGFLYFDVNRMVRVFGTTESARNEFNLVWTDQMEKDTNSGLNNIFRDRNQNVTIFNFYRQDCVFPGYTAEFICAYNNDQPSFHFNTNNVLVRPDPVGVFTPHQLDIGYLGWGGFGHVNRINVSHQFYWAFGRDSRNPLANTPQDVSAYFAAIELSIDRDWARFRSSFLYSSGDGNISNSRATGFDSIIDNPNFAGGMFSFFQRQAIPLFGIFLTQGQSFIPDMRSSKIQGQSNFVNPGLFLANAGVDMDITPKWKSINNVNFLWFDKTNVLEQFVFQSNIDQFIGVDASMGLEYRPFLNNNVVAVGGFSTLFPGSGFHDLYNRFKGGVNPLCALFLQLTLLY